MIPSAGSGAVILETKCDCRYTVGRWDHPSDCRHVTLAQSLEECHPGACGHATQVQGQEGFTVETVDM